MNISVLGSHPREIRDEPIKMKMDARTRYTKKVLKESLLELLKTKNLNSITVKELCQLAEINRATFYKHYSDCDHLLRSIEDDFLEKYAESLTIDDWVNSRALITAILDTIDSNIELCNVLSFNKENPAFLRRMVDIAHIHCINLWHAEMPQVPEQNLRMLFTYLSNGLAAIIYNYYKTCDREFLLDFMSERVNNCLEPYLKQYTD